VDAERRRWLDALICACERLIDNVREDPSADVLRADTEALIARLRREIPESD
jgi:hypothetical protein